MAQKNRWHPVMLPDDYLRKMKQDLAEVEAQVESKTRYEPDPESYNVVGLRGPCRTVRTTFLRSRTMTDDVRCYRTNETPLRPTVTCSPLDISVRDSRIPSHEGA